MPDQRRGFDIQTRTEATDPVPVVAVVGRLRRADGGPLCQLLVDELAASPTGLVIDLGEVEVEPGAGEVLLPLARQVRAWPDRPFALCRRPTSLRPPQVPIFVTRELAGSFAQSFAVPPQRTQQLERMPAASREARSLVTRACGEWRLDDLLPSAQLVITELVNNAVLHTTAHFLVTVTLTDGGLHLAVRDTSRLVPRMRAAERVGPEGGQGLTLINAFASAWGTTLVPDGKVVWADLRE